MYRGGSLGLRRKNNQCPVTWQRLAWISAASSGVSEKRMRSKYRQYFASTRFTCFLLKIDKSLGVFYAREDGDVRECPRR